MVKGPAVVVVARHGARLDAADKQWHLTSPTPYDPPLTYGGWSQGKALGLRIASLLHAREVEAANEAKNGQNGDASPNGSGADSNGKSANGVTPRPKKRKHKIIIHSSPFLRCVQTSTAIAAGISQFQPPRDDPAATAPNLKVPQPPTERSRSPLGQSPSTSPAVQPVRGREAEKSRSDSPPNQRKHSWLRLTNPAVNSKPYIGPEKILLRIDAFLGEWLNPEYYEDITAPPNSTMMVAGAKADLLRRSDYVEAPPKAANSGGHFPGGWARVPSAANNRKNTGDGSFPNLGALGQALPHHERSTSHGSGLTRQRSRSQEPHGPDTPASSRRPNGRLYDAPSPSYAVSPSDPIPRGYFNHARDACLRIDFQWDSMREPQCWGDGGEFGDEWSTMHKRFRKGLAGMMQWYREHGSTTKSPQHKLAGFTFNERTSGPVKGPLKATHTSELKSKAEAEDDEELVLVLVTHGAGCNALLGAITNQPVLMDVSLASLSMAVRRDTPRESSASNLFTRRSSVADPGMVDTYEMKLIASVDHLRPGVDPAKPPQPQPQSPAVTSPSLEYRRRIGTSGTNTPVSQIESPFSLGPPARSGWNSSLGSIRRTSTSTSGWKSYSSNPSGASSPHLGSGLWGGSLRSVSFNDQRDGRASPGADMVDMFQNHSKPASTSNTMHSSTPNNTPSRSDTASIPTVDGAISPKLTRVNSHEDDEKHDDVAPLKAPKVRTASPVITANAKPETSKTGTTGGGAGGLWGGGKTTTASTQGLWGPPKLDEVYEHGRGPKRRWTTTEREQE